MIWFINFHNYARTLNVGINYLFTTTLNLVHECISGKRFLPACIYIFREVQHVSIHELYLLNFFVAQYCTLASVCPIFALRVLREYNFKDSKSILRNFACKSYWSQDLMMQWAVNISDREIRTEAHKLFCSGVTLI